MERCVRLFLVLLAATLLGGAVGGAAAPQKQAAYSPRVSAI